jgi:hypothetical protein
MARKQKKITPLVGILLVAAVAVYAIIGKAVIDSGDPWNALGTVGVVLMTPLVVAIPLVFIFLWISSLLDSLMKKEYLWAIFIFILPAVCILYWLLNRKNKARK